MVKHSLQSDVAFRLMALEFRLRDLLRPPRRILQGAGMQPGMAVLDFGCGPGGFSLAAAGLVGQEGRIFAFDIHPLAVKMVQRIAAKKGIRNLRAIPGSGIDGLPEESLDMVLLYDVLHDIREPNSTLAEIHRVLKVEGVLSVSDHHLRENTILDTVTAGRLFRFCNRSRWTFQFQRVKLSEDGT